MNNNLAPFHFLRRLAFFSHRFLELPNITNQEIKGNIVATYRFLMDEEIRKCQDKMLIF